MTVRLLLLAAVTLGAPPATACWISVPWMRYINLVRLDGPKVEGLKWVRIYNILDYDGAVRVTVHAIREGRRIPVARWENGQECAFDLAGQQRCRLNQPDVGVSLEAFFTDWTEASDRMDRLKYLRLPLILEMDGREIPMTLRSRAVRNNRELQSERNERALNEVCPERE